MRTMTTAVGTALVALSVLAPVAGQTIAPPTRGQDLVAHVSAGAGYDDDVLVGSGLLDPRAQTSGSYGITDLNLNYSAQNRRVSFGAGANSAFRFYRTGEPFTARHHGGSAGLSVAVTSRLRAAAAVAAQRSSHHIFWIFPGLREAPLGQVTLPSLDYSLTSSAGRSYQTTAELAYALTRRSSLAAEYGYGSARFGEDAFDLTTERWSGRYTYGFTRYASLRLGYGVEDAEYTGRRQFRRRTIDAGIDYSRPLSFSRRTTFRFGAGTAALEDGTSTYTTVTGHASLDHVLSRRWGLNVAYNRGIGFVDGFLDPFVSDAAAVRVDGSLSRRVQVGASAAYSNGTIGLAAPRTRGYETYTGAGRIQVAMVGRLAAFGEYVYYHYRFDPLVTLPLNSPRSLNRRGVRGGLTYTAVIF